MGRKRKRELPPFCYYCYSTTDPNSLLTFPNEAQLLIHQKKSHFKCQSGRCHKQFPSIHALAAHSSVVHNETITKVPNASKEMENELTLQVFGMQNVPEHILMHRASLCSGEQKTKSKQAQEQEDLAEFERRVKAEFIIQQHKLAQQRAAEANANPTEYETNATSSATNLLSSITPNVSSAQALPQPSIPPRHFGYSILPQSSNNPPQNNAYGRPAPIGPPAIQPLTQPVSLANQTVLPLATTALTVPMTAASSSQVDGPQPQPQSQPNSKPQTLNINTNTNIAPGLSPTAIFKSISPKVDVKLNSNGKVEQSS